MRRRVSDRVIWGVILIALGLFLLLRGYTGYDLGNFIGDWWPLVFVAVGVSKLLSGDGRSMFAGLSFIILGLIILGVKFDIIERDWIVSFWPLILIVIGLNMLLRRSGMRELGIDESTEEFVEMFAVLGGLTRTARSASFRGGELKAVLGGVELDLSDAELAEGTHTLHATAILGGCNIRVPRQWEVEVRGTPILGAVEDKRRSSETEGEGGGRLIINCFAVMGGIEVKD